MINLVNLLRRVARQIVLPGRKKTGNLLTSVFLLFDGLVEQVLHCRRAVIGTTKIPAWALGKVWLRRGMLVVAWGLFILTSFEWGGGQTRESIVESPVQTISVAAASESCAPVTAGDLPQYPVVAQTGFDRPPTVNPRTKRWLLLRTLRI